MVSANTLLRAVLVVASATTFASAQPSRILERVPLMPRIPSHAKHHEVLRARSDMAVDPAVLVSVECLDPTEPILLHDETVAQLSICGGMPGSIDGCLGSPRSTVGEAGTAIFTVTADAPEADITVSKERWMRCVHAARDRCPTGSLAATCVGGASAGDISFVLEMSESHDL